MPSASLHLRQLRDIALATVLSCGAVAAHAAADKPRSVKVMVISMFALEEAEWTGKLKLDRVIPVPGLSPLYPAVRCNKDDVCPVSYTHLTLPTSDLV